MGRVSSDSSLGGLLDELASAKPAPASGSAAAAAAALAAALLEKVARLSGRTWEGAAGARERAHQLRRRAEALVEADRDAYLDFVAAGADALRLEAARSRTIDVPLDLTRCAVALVELAHELAEKGNPKLRADAAAAAILAHAAISCGAMLVQVNLGAVVRDPRLEEALTLMRQASQSVRQMRGPTHGESPERTKSE